MENSEPDSFEILLSPGKSEEVTQSKTKPKKQVAFSNSPIKEVYDKNLKKMVSAAEFNKKQQEE